MTYVPRLVFHLARPFPFRKRPHYFEESPRFFLSVNLVRLGRILFHVDGPVDGIEESVYRWCFLGNLAAARALF